MIKLFLNHDRENLLIFTLKELRNRIGKLHNGIKVRVFFGKNIEKKHLCRHDKRYYYFCKTNIPGINLIAAYRNIIKVSKNMSL